MKAEAHGRQMLTLDILRCCAAMSALIFHLCYWAWAAPGSTPQSISLGVYKFPEGQWLTSALYPAVEALFVISGLVICQTARGRTAHQFLQARMWRVLPTAMICATTTLAIAFAVAWKPPAELIERYLRSALLFPYGPWIDGVYWTLGIELSFYAIVFVTLSIGAIRPHLERILICGGLIIAAAWISGLPMSLSSTMFGDVRTAGTAELLILRHDIVFITAELLLLRHGMFFALGCLVARSWRLGGWTPARAAIMIVLVAAGLDEISVDPSVDPSTATVARMLWLGFVAALLISPRLESYLQGISPTSKAMITAAALATYPLYLLHDVGGAAALRVASIIGLPRLPALLTTIVVVCAASGVVSGIIEPRLKAALRRDHPTPGRAKEIPVEMNF
jgi:peptidoglycan/LPS O-acetylase OafA/YrhL